MGGYITNQSEKHREVLYAQAVEEASLSSSRTTSSSALALPLPLPARFAFSLTCAINCASGRSSAMPDLTHDETTVADRTDSSERACRYLDTVNPPREKARSASAEVAKAKLKLD